MQQQPALVSPVPNRRLAVIGGGMGGVAAAYFCDPEWTTDLFEARSKLGGNASTLTVDDDGHEVAVDIGAESFNPGTHPIYWELLQEIELIRSSNGAQDLLIEMPGTLSIFDAKTKSSLFVSTHPLRTLKHAINFFVFSRAALQFVSRNPSSGVTVGAWFEQLWIDRAFKRDVLLPWLASLTCYSVETLKQQSLLAFLMLFIHVFPKNIFNAPKTYCSSIGLCGVLEMLVARCSRLSVHTDAAVSKLEEVDGVWFVETASGRHGPYDRVVVNAPPHASTKFLSNVPGELLEVLAAHKYYSARLVIHRDPIYMPANRSDWCSHNAAVDGDICEASIWLGSARKNPKTGKPVALFKSWASKRAEEPKQIVAEQTFLHPMLSRETMRATKALASWQGYKGLLFTGHYTTVTDLQETALYSGMAVAKSLSPASERLSSLHSRAARSGPMRASYEVAD